MYLSQHCKPLILYQLLHISPACILLIPDSTKKQPARYRASCSSSYCLIGSALPIKLHNIIIALYVLGALFTESQGTPINRAQWPSINSYR